MPAPLPYGRQSIDDADLEAVEAVLNSDYLTTGPEVDLFERALSLEVGSPHVAVLNSGTSALHAAYAAGGLGPGSRLLTTPLTFASTATMALHLGADVVFADVDDSTLTLDSEQVEAVLSPTVRVICVVDFAGHPGDLERLGKVARKHDCLLVEDAAHSIGGTYRGRPIGSVAPVTTFSFHPVKNMTTAEGGAVVSSDASFIQSVKRFRSHGMEREPSLLRYAGEGPWHQEVQSLGLNLRMPDVLAALGRSQLTRLGRMVSRRRVLVERYLRLLEGIPGLRLPGRKPDCEPAWHLFPVRVLEGRRKEVFQHLRRQGIGVQVHYLPVYRHPLFEDLGYKRGLCPVAEKAYEELISLPLFPDLTETQQDRVIEALRTALGE